MISQEIKKWLLVLSMFLVVLVLLLFFFVHSIHSFLAPTQPISNCKILVVESWIDHVELNQSVKEFERGDYKVVLVPGMPNQNTLMNRFLKSNADICAITLACQGIPYTKIVPVRVSKVFRDRTYQSALLVRQWLESHHLENEPVNLFSGSVHARRSWMLYRRALGNKHKVGVISTIPFDYDAAHWWRTSNGFRAVVDEFVAYLYAALLFHPDM